MGAESAEHTQNSGRTGPQPKREPGAGLSCHLWPACATCRAAVGALQRPGWWCAVCSVWWVRTWASLVRLGVD